MNKKILAILDREERYAKGLMEYMMKKENLPFRIHVFLSPVRFFEYIQNEQIECLLIGESLYDESFEDKNIPHIIILSESGNRIDNTLCHVNKYQSSEAIYKELLNYYSEETKEDILHIRNCNKKLKIIGIYTPIRRCLQTTFSVCLGQMLSKKGKCLYLNFERYSGFSQLFGNTFSNDLSDLMYYFECAKEKLSLRIETMIETVNGLDFIPPVNVFQNLCGIRGQQWAELFVEIEKCTEYEYLLLDLTDDITQLWEILQCCDAIFTISRQDPLAVAKIDQYEKLLTSSEYSDIWGKTTKYALPLFKDLPNNFNELTKGELSQYIKSNVITVIDRIQDSKRNSDA